MNTITEYAIRKAALSDCSLIRSLASLTWGHTYGSILSPEQLDYMFEWMYSVESLENQMQSGHVFYLMYEGENPVGYVSVEKENENRYHLQKLYVIPEKQGCGLGKLLIAQAEKHVNEVKKTENVLLVLNVNRYNKARYFYEKLGFRIESEGDFDIGNGYYMNDYIMVKEVG